ncbi:TonB-dependent receptor domain-containing protein [Steroidobacter sp.]|uniref:TonB-dependent receptor domain-containing protein n=1 Tax=Steroidobacter sp. TaxID=1978227 RepID=UPI001A64433D|nr:TonB-dependent receptor [Steroidobacter sp.]MBL8270607.1 TonB-dependent receptor [Steroidobacter sp.]
MSSYLRSSVHTVLLSAALATAGVASAAEPQQTTFIEEIEVIVVTGSYIEGAAEDAALPIDVLRAEDLAKQGSPSMVELVKSIPSMQGVVGEANQFTAANTVGASNANLRGLGGARTLVLMNGRRLVPSPAPIGYDLNLLPMAALGRIEVLKDGAAATYGSDAVAGVVNFITKRGFEGMSVEGAYSYIDGSDGDYNANISFGTKGEGWDLLLAGGYRRRSELSATDRDFAVPSITQNPQGGFSSFGNPGTFIIPGGTVAAGTNAFRDPACAALGNTPTGVASCTFQFTPFDNLIEEEEHYNAYAEFNMLFGESIDFHVEAMYAVHDVPAEHSSPAYAPTQGATLTNGIPSAPTFSISKNNPGLASLLPLLTTAQQAAIAAAPALAVSGLQWRPFGVGGNPLTGGAKEDERLFDGARLSTSLSGETKFFNWDVGLTYATNTRQINTQDIIVTRLQAALNGLGGPNCATNTPGANGCLWLNPFSSAIQANVITGAQNNLTFNPNAVNTRELAAWLYQSNGFEDETTSFVVDTVLNGQMSLGFEAGDIGWAAGLQYREETFERDPNDLTDVTKNPCVNTLSTGNTTCTIQSGVFSFFGPATPQDLTRDVKAVFGELNIPVLESLSAQVALRYETYGGSVGSTTNPKFSLRWQALDWFTLRGSVGSTFRGPLQTQLVNSPTTNLAFTPAAGGYKTYDIFGSSNLKPEEALTFNVGMIFKAGGFNATLDYWSYDFEDALENESGTEIVAAFFGTTAPTAAVPNPPNQCDNAAFDRLQTRFTFQNNVCSIGNLLRVRTNTINGPDQRISGIDAGVSYLFDDVIGGDLLVGVDATYTLEYERDAAIVEGIQIQAANDFVGTRGASGIGAGTLPEIRGAAFVDYSTNWLAAQGVRLTARYIDGVTDVRAGLATATTRGVEIGSFLTYDLVYRLSLPAQTTLTASVINLTDEDPPFVRLDLSYDPFIANPYGRYFKLLLNKKF